MNIIGGPAVRRTEKDVVYIWVITDERPNKVHAIASITPDLATQNQVASGEVLSSDIICLGDHIFAVMIPVRAARDAYPLDTKIYYDVFVDDNSLSHFGLTSGKHPIVYESDVLPSFYLPTKHHRIVQGSCRKPHAGKGSHAQFDQINKIDSHINTSFSKTIDKRPSMLCLTGDQIYADDVAAPLLSAINAKARYLTGWDEALPNEDGESEIIPSNIKLGLRGEVLNDDNGFTSSHKENHLMTFGEYLTMYLVVWGGIDIELPSYEEQISNIGIKKVKVRRPKHTVTIAKPVYTDDEYTDEKAIVDDFLKTAWKMRRIMANTITYMMFDDHEVTDDWNLTEKNHDRLRSNSLSRRIQSNALAAYWVCQGWGNNPDDFGDESFINNISNFLQSKSSIGGDLYENTLLGKDYWGYEVEGYPYLIALDTRSDRIFEEGDEFSQLMSPNRISHLSERLKQINDKYNNELTSQSILLLSPPPILGFKSVEMVQLLFDFIPTTVDGEPWIGSETSYHNLLTALRNIKFKHCSVISGDVHYSFVRRLELDREGEDSLFVTQYTSSSLHNSPSGTARFILSIFSDSELAIFGRENTPYLFPNNLKSREEFLTGHTGCGVLEFKDGIPKLNTFHFKDASRKKSYQWKYVIDKPLKFEIG